MEKELVPNNTTLAGLRGLLREARKNTTPEEAVCIDLKLWDYNFPSIKENIGVYRSGTEEGTSYFKNIGEAREWIDSWKEEADGHRPESSSSIED